MVLARSGGQRRRTARRAALLAAAVFALGATVAVASAPLPRGSRTSSSHPAEPRPLDGVRLRGATGLRLVLARARPLVLAVDRDAVVPVRGVPRHARGVVSVVPVRGRAAAIVAPSGPDAAIYGLSPSGASASHLGLGKNVVPDAARDVVWIQAVERADRCAIRAVTVAGRTTRPPRSFPCAATIASAGRAGVVVNRIRLYEPATGRAVLRLPFGLVAAAGTTLVLAGPGKSFTLFDVETRRRRRVRWPSTIGAMDPAAADPRGRFVALGFATPSWGGGRQALDIWLLEVRTGELTQLPGMPAFVELKRTSMTWTDDGRLVLLARSEGRDLVAVWRSGRRRLTIKTVHLPRSTGSDTFASLG